MAGDKADVKQPSPSSLSPSAGGFNDNSALTKRLIQSTSLQPLKTVNRRSDDDVTVTSSSASPSSSPVAAVNVRQTRAIFESAQ